MTNDPVCLCGHRDSEHLSDDSCGHEGCRCPVFTREEIRSLRLVDPDAEMLKYETRERDRARALDD